MLNYEFPPIGGGAARAHVCVLKQYAERNGLSVHVLTSAPKPGFVTENFARNITIYKVGLHKNNLHYWRKAEVLEWLYKARRHYNRLLSQNTYDLVHAFFAFPTAWLCYKAKTQLPYIVSLRGSDVPGYNIRLNLDYKLFAGLFRRIWSGASAVVANSKGLRELASRFMPNLDIRIIPNGVDTDVFHPAESRNLVQPIQALTVGRLIGRKRIDLLISAIAAAGKLGLNIRLNIAGEGNLTTRLKRLTDELGLADSVNFLGRVRPEQIPQLYQQNHLLLFSSAHEGMSNAMLEAMACGLPIITTRCEGVEELIKDNGIVVGEARPETIAGAVKLLVDDEEKYKQMAAAARNRAKQFSWSNVAEQYLRLYNTVLSSGNYTLKG